MPGSLGAKHPHLHPQPSLPCTPCVSPQKEKILPPSHNPGSPSVLSHVPYPKHFQASSCPLGVEAPSSLNLSHPGREQEMARPEAVEIRPLLEVGTGPEGPADLLSKRAGDMVAGGRPRTGRPGIEGHLALGAAL